ncbi:MAG: type I secretion system permease/ATPase [Burkholderiales bacterium]
MFPNKQWPARLAPAIAAIRPTLIRVAWISVIVNVLALAPTLYMLQVYDRVVSTRNHNTLVMLTILVLGMYLVLEVLEWARGRMLQGAGLQLEAHLGERVFNAAFQGNLLRVRGSNQALGDLRTLREFLGAPAVTALMDAPLALIFLLLIFLINPYLGWFSLAVAVVQVGLAYWAERATREPLSEARQAAMAAQNYVNSSLRSAAVVEAMGFLRPILDRWMKEQKKLLHFQAIASEHAGGKGAAARLAQNILSSGLLGLSCWFLLQGELAGGAGMMIIASLLGGKALAPLVQLIGSWKSILDVRAAYQRLDNVLEAIPNTQPGMPLPPPQGALGVEAVIAGAPGSQLAILRGISFSLAAGKALVVFGPSGSGKSTLARLLVGIWQAQSGKVRLDGVDIFPWNKTELGPFIGYLPQNIELFNGTVAENIARFGEVDYAKVEAAARAVGLHETLQSLPQGYQSQIGEDGFFLSGGQRQRVGLARALYGNPKFVVLDEPNSSLDEAGELALQKTLMGLKAQGTTLVMISHRTSVLAAADSLLVLRAGQVAAFGPRDEVLAKLSAAHQSAKASGANESSGAAIEAQASI